MKRLLPKFENHIGSITTDYIIRTFLNMNIIIWKEIRDIFLTLVSACKKNFKEFMIVSLMAGFAIVSSFYINLSKSVYVISNQSAERQYSKDTALINFLKLRVTTVETQLEESNKYVKLVRDKLEDQQKDKEKK